MPKATVSHDHIKYELATCPGGFVQLRKLTYEEVLIRRDGATKLSLEAQQAAQGNGTDNTGRMELETLQIWSRKFEFTNCIVDHNLEDDNGVKLDFKNPMTFKVLDPAIAREIERHIDRLNGEDDEAQLVDFTPAVSSLSEETTPKPSAVTVESKS